MVFNKDAKKRFLDGKRKYFNIKRNHALFSSNSSEMSVLE
jgi:hypothetical protein